MTTKKFIEFTIKSLQTTISENDTGCLLRRREQSKTQTKVPKVKSIHQQQLNCTRKTVSPQQIEAKAKSQDAPQAGVIDPSKLQI